MNEGMNQSSLRCFDDILIKKQGRTYSTDRSSLARYGDISLMKVQPRYGDISWKLKGLFYPPKIFFLPNTAASTKTKLPNHKITFGTSNWHKYFSILEKAVDSNNNLFSTKLQTVPTRK